GDLQERTQFIQLKTNIQYTFKVAADTYRSSYVLDKGSGWQAFLRAIKVRDRITHPKDPAKMAISDQEVEDVNLALNWFEKALQDLFSGSDFLAFLRSLQRQQTNGPQELR